MSNQPDIDQAASTIESEGFRNHAGALSASLCDALFEEIERLSADGAAPARKSNLLGHKTAHFFDLLNGADIWQALRPQENLLPSIPAARVAAFEPELQQIIGRRPSKTGLGRIFVRES